MEHKDLEIKKIKVSPVLTCEANDSVNTIAKKLKDHKERRIFVVDAGKLKGIITTTDLVYKALAINSLDLKAKDVMTSQVKSVDIKEDLEKALGIMNEIKTFTCPLTDNGKLLGLISYHDLVSHVLSHVKK